MKKLVIGSRGSRLALTQSETVRRLLAGRLSIEAEIRVIKTRGDRISDTPFSSMEGKGFFTKEIEEALLAGEIDLAVHSMKDLSTTFPTGLEVAAVCSREDPREIVLIRPDSFDPDQPLGVLVDGFIGTSSVRRQCQIAGLMPSLTIRDLRGNVPTRISKLADGEYDAIIIAFAGVRRLKLDISEFEQRILDTDDFIPAPAQGALAIEVRSDDREVSQTVSTLNDPDTRLQVDLERGLLARFDGGCQLPLGATVRLTDDGFRLDAVLGIGSPGNWSGLKRASAEGTDVGRLIEDVYSRLTVL
jgi:hydroxymethylbilane synthase